MNIEIGNKSTVEYEIAKNKDGDTVVSTDYSKLSNKPSINDVTLEGNKTLEELGIQPKGNYLTEHQDLSNYYNKTEIDAMIGNIETLLSEV